MTKYAETVRFHKKLLYSLPGEPSLTPDSTCGELVEKLTAICLAQPDFLRPEGCRRYLHLLPDFKNFVFPVSRAVDKTERKILVAGEPLRAVRRAIHQWVFSYFEGEQHPILPSYALDLTQFMARMIRGHHHFPWGEPYSFQVSPLVRLAEDDPLTNLDPDRRFKTDFTQSNRLRGVTCLVPGTGSVKIHNRVLFNAGDEFTFVVHRCHLSTGFSDYIDAECVEAPRLDMQEEFQFFGHIEMEGSTISSPKQFQSSVPAHWIIAARVWDRMSPAETRLPVPFSTVDR